MKYRVSVARSVVLGLAALMLAACGPASPLAPFFPDDDDPSPPSGPNFSFQIPSDGDVVADVVTLAVSGSGLARARFRIDGNDTFLDEDTPFEWTLDPADFVLGTHVLRVDGWNTGGLRQGVEVEVVLERAVPLADIQAAIDSLLPSHWYEIPNSRLRAVAWDDSADPLGDVRDIMEASSGGAFDWKRNRLMVWGGSPYLGNEVYAFDLGTAAWARLTDPSPRPIPDESPTSRHSGDALAYLPEPVDRLFLGGGYGGPDAFLFDLENLTWSKKASYDPAAAASGPNCALAADGRVWLLGGGSAVLSAYDPGIDEWTAHGGIGGWWPAGTTAEIDPVGNRYVVLGDARAFGLDLAAPLPQGEVLSFTGDVEILDERGPGLAYHGTSDRLVAWSGGSAVYSINMTSKSITRIESSGTVDPGAAQPRGTYGRWCYVPSRDVFIVVNSIDTNVFVYRLP